MSDLFDTREKVVEGANWRGSITIQMDGEERELCVRQLRDTEFFKVMKKIDRDELSDLRNHLPKEDMEEYRELLDKDDKTDAEQERLTELEEQLEDSSAQIFDALSEETFEGIVLAARYAIEPDEADLKKAFYEYADEIEQEKNITVREPEDCYEWCKERVHEMLDNSTNLQSFVIGMQAIAESTGGEGN